MTLLISSISYQAQSESPDTIGGKITPPKAQPTKSVVILNTVTIIGDSEFYNKALTSVVIPNSVTSIGDGAFARNQLTSVVIPNSVTRIGPDAFRNNKLTSVVIPANVSIGKNESMGTYGEAFKTLYTNPSTGGAGTYKYVQGTGWTKKP